LEKPVHFKWWALKPGGSRRYSYLCLFLYETGVRCGYGRWGVAGD